MSDIYDPLYAELQVLFTVTMMLSDSDNRSDRIRAGLVASP